MIEADGGAYPCDFYVLDEWKCGNIIDNSVEEIFSSDNAKKFRETYNKIYDYRAALRAIEDYFAQQEKEL